MISSLLGVFLVPRRADLKVTHSENTVDYMYIATTPAKQSRVFPPVIQDVVCFVLKT